MEIPSAYAEAPPPVVNDPLARPRMRGWLHLYAFGVSLVCGVVLVSLAAGRPQADAFWACLVYSLTVCATFGTSALYHRRVWGPRGYGLMKRLDHSMIFLLIAGTYTPFSVLLLDDPTRLLTLVWSWALAGVVLKVAWPKAPRWLSMPLYIGLGWVAVFILPDILHRGGVAALVLLTVGGVAYSVGAMFYALRWPNPWPRTFGHHEFFHACTLLAATCHHIAAYVALYA